MILVKWCIFSHTQYEEAKENTGTGIIMGYAFHPTMGTLAIIAPLGSSKPVEVPIRDLEFVVNPNQGKRKSKHALKALQKPEKDTQKELTPTD
jgi:hypothetical protein